MKKYLTLLFLVCAVALTFTGCGNSLSDSISLDYKVESSGSGNSGGNSGSGSGSIIGTWYGGQAGTSFTLTFKEGGSFSYITNFTPDTPVPGTYTLDGSIVTVRVVGNMSSTGTYSGSTISFPSNASGGLFAGLTFTKR